MLPVSFFDSDRRLFRDVCFLFVNNEENKQTNKPTNQPTNKQTNQKETASFCQLKAAERGVLAADQQIDRPRKKKKIKTKRKNVQLWFAVFFSFSIAPPSAFYWRHDPMSDGFLASLSLSLSLSFFFLFLFFLISFLFFLFHGPLPGLIGFDRWNRVLVFFFCFWSLLLPRESAPTEFYRVLPSFTVLYLVFLGST